MAEESFSNIREILSDYIGSTVVDISQHDSADEGSFVQLLFDNGGYMKFPIGDEGFDHWCFCPSDEECCDDEEAPPRAD